RPVDAENVKLKLNMNMSGMVMHSGAKIKKDDKIGDYQVHLTPDMASDWSVDLSNNSAHDSPKKRQITLPFGVRYHRIVMENRSEFINMKRSTVGVSCRY